MNFEHLLIIFIIIILPISFVMNMYVNTQADTLNMQSLYDLKLSNATNDALKAYQSNSFNESTSDITQMKMRNIEASANVYMNSLANNFNMQGFSKETLQAHVPALVFTMYDGFYIYSKFDNDIRNINIDDNNNVGYKEGLTYGVKPYINYSCRYKRDNGDDFVITYALDNYITIQGAIGGNWVNDSGYLIDNISNDTGNTIKYRGAIIGSESRNIFKEHVGNTVYSYIKQDGIKKYYDAEKNTNEKKNWFYVINGIRNYIYDEKQKTPDEIGNDYSAYNYYKKASEFKERILQYGLGTLEPREAVEAYKTDSITSYDQTNENSREKFYEYNFGTTNPTAKIFQFKTNPNDVSIEDPESNFNEHRRAVIRYSIEKNLSIAIANYNKFSNVSTNFQMPVLAETEWDKVLNNICLISFMQGIPMGNKFYNGSSVVQNNKNSEVVAEDSIYIVPYNETAGNTGSDNTLYYYDIKKKDLIGEVQDPVGILNMDLEKRKLYNTGGVIYYYPKMYYADYESVVTKSKNVNISAENNDNDMQYAFNGNIYKYLYARCDAKLAKAYYTALGRERYCAYKVNKIK